MKIEGKIKIKVIKKKDLENVNKMVLAAEKIKPEKTKNEMISTVSNWVDEFQRLRREETKQGFEQLFTKNLLPSQLS